MSEAQIVDTLVNATVGNLALIVLIVLGVLALRVFNASQRQAAEYHKQNTETISVLAEMAKGFRDQSIAAYNELNAVQISLQEEKTVNADKLDRLGEIQLKVAEMAENSATALSRQEGKLDHIVATTDRVDANATQRLAMLQQVIGNQNLTNTRLGELEATVTHLVDVVSLVDSRTERSDALIKTLPPLSKTLEIVVLVLQGKIDEALAEQKRTSGLYPVAADG